MAQKFHLVHVIRNSISCIHEKIPWLGLSVAKNKFRSLIIPWAKESCGSNDGLCTYLL